MFIIQYLILGLGTGSIYALSGHAIVAVFRGSRVLNFASTAIGMAGAYFAYELATLRGWPLVVANLSGVAVAAALALVVQLILRLLRDSTAIAKVIATLGVLLALQSLAVLRYGDVAIIPGALVQGPPIEIGSDIVVPQPHIVIITCAAVMTALLWCLYKFSLFGLVTTASSENEEAVSAFGRSPNRIAMLNWTIGGAISGIAVILVAPIVTLQPSVFLLLLVAALASALVGNFTSFPLTLVGGILIGVLQALSVQFDSIPGLSASLPFLVIIAVLVIRGRSIPLRSQVLSAGTTVGNGRVRPLVVVPLFVLTVVISLVVSASWADSIAITLGFATIALSLVVLTGYAGQISLGQFALAGVGAYVAGRLVSVTGLPFELAILVAVAVAVPVGALFALPAVKTRGMALAVVSLGMGAMVEYMLFNNSDLTGGPAGTFIGSQHFFGIDIDSVLYPGRYAVVTLVVFTLAALGVAALRRSPVGKRFLAIRTNERAAASLGISVARGKVFAFSVASALAALGGTMVAFRGYGIVYYNFTTFISIAILAYAVIGGIGYIGGALLGAALISGGVIARLGESIFHGISLWLPTIGGLALILMLIQDPNGIASQNVHAFDKLLARLRARRTQRSKTPEWREVAQGTQVAAVPAKHLVVRGLTVDYGGTRAVDHVDLEVAPGEIVGLIGPNGAGKTTFIDAVSGLANETEGTIDLGGVELTELTAARRAQLGLTRSFQSLELFDDMTVLENLLTGADVRSGKGYTRALFSRSRPLLPPAAAAAVDEFGLEGDLFRLAGEMPQGRRRLVAIARAVATEPSVLMLDEPAAGLASLEARELQHLVRGLAKRRGIGILLVEHDMDFVMRLCDRIVVLNFGAVLSTGTPAQVQADERVQAAYFGEQIPEVESAGTVS